MLLHQVPQGCFIEPMIFNHQIRCGKKGKKTAPFWKKRDEQIHSADRLALKPLYQLVQAIPSSWALSMPCPE